MSPSTFKPLDTFNFQFLFQKLNNNLFNILSLVTVENDLELNKRDAMCASEGALGNWGNKEREKGSKELVEP